MDWLWALAATATTFVLALSMRSTLSDPALLRRNFAGRDVPTAGGVVAVFGLIVVVTVASTVDRFEFSRAIYVAWLVVGFALLGLFDDVVGDASARGLRGHLAAARRGQLTSGVLKLVFGLVIAWFVSPVVGSSWHRVLSALVIAGSANVANLLDVAPARATKVAVFTLVVVGVLSQAVAIEGGQYWFVFAVVALLPFELSESLMLGDTGANPLGAVVGFALVVATYDSMAAVAIAAAVVVGINVAGELVSFSRVINRVPPLRALDRLGRRR